MELREMERYIHQQTENNEITKKELKHTSLFKNAYCKNNFRIVDTDCNFNKCFVLFSSNGLYYPDAIKVFENVIINKDKYEWTGLFNMEEIQNYAKRIVFIRDINKRWYSLGINKTLNNIIQLHAFLKTITNGYEVITAGGSSGGYAAVVLGLMLDAKRIFSFSGQFNIVKEIEKLEIYEDHVMDNGILRDVVPLVLKKPNIPIYYFFPANSPQDMEQYELVKDIKNVYSFWFGYSQHGSTMIGINKRDVLSFDRLQLDALYERCNGKVLTKFDFAKACMDVQHFSQK